MAIARLKGTDLAYDKAGDGEFVILVHGSWVDHHDWDLVVSALAQDFYVITYDRRGHSKSTAPTGQGYIKDDVADLAALIELVDQGPAHVVGHSMGGSIALKLAISRPELCRSVSVHEPSLLALLAIDPALAPALTEVQARIESVVELLARGEHEAGAQRFIETVALGPGAWKQLPEPARETFIGNAPTFLDEYRDPDQAYIELGSLRAYQGAVQLTQGEQSPPFFAAVADTLASVLPRADRLIYRGAGHIPHVTHPDDFSRGLIGFLTRSA
jgi:pimeloyl-ACP methyl ester carboxylesterase